MDNLLNMITDAAQYRREIQGADIPLVLQLSNDLWKKIVKESTLNDIYCKCRENNILTIQIDKTYGYKTIKLRKI
jgi:hypothetical protein